MKEKRTEVTVASEFQKRFDDDHVLIKSPGRVNLIGEHTDYNQGFVLPAAVDNNIVLALQLNTEQKGCFYAVDKNEYFETDVSGDLSPVDEGWPNYLLGVLDQLRAHGYEVEGFNCVFGGNIPIGAGMSSSAALEGGVLYGLDHLLDLNIPPVEMAKIAQKAENDFVGVQCGIMDQFVSLNGKEDHALKLDCRSLEYEYYPFKRKDICIVLCDTQVRRELASSEYNVRRTQCEEGVKIFHEKGGGIKSLRDVSLDLLSTQQTAMDPVVYQRCKFVVEENNRVLQACSDLKEEDFHSFGQRMYKSHAGLRDEYEVSCEELDILVEAAQKINGVLGARMMGGGFGGCTINLVEDSSLDEFTQTITESYNKQTDKELKVYQTKVSGGTQVIESSLVC